MPPRAPTKCVAMTARRLPLCTASTGPDFVTHSVERPWWATNATRRSVRPPFASNTTPARATACDGAGLRSRACGSTSASNPAHVKTATTASRIEPFVCRVWVRSPGAASRSPRKNALVIKVALVGAFMSAFTPFHSHIKPLTNGQKTMLKKGGAYHTGCPVGLNDLRVLTVTYRGFDKHNH